MSQAALSGGAFADLVFDDLLSERGPFEDAARSSESDSWLMSYLDMLMLLITFFVLMLALYGGQLADRDAPALPTVTTLPIVTPLPPLVPAVKLPPALSLPSVSAGEFYQPPRQIKPAPLASDVGFYSPGRVAMPEPVVASTPMAFQVPLFEVPAPVSQPRPASALPQIDGVEVKPIAHGYNLRIQDHLLFDSSAVGLSANGRQLIEKLIPLLQEFHGTISVEGHTDSVPIATARFPSNWELSAARASAVVRVLRMAGVDGDRLRAIGYASTHPLDSNHTPTGRANNRRVELVLQDATSPAP